MFDVFPDYGNCLVNLVASVMAHFGADPPHRTLPAADRLLKPGYRNVVLLLLDGLGTQALRAACPEGGFLLSGIQAELSSVYPSTTVAAVASMESGLEPAEHGWLGWTQYFPQIGKNVDMFSGRLQHEGAPAAQFYVPGRYLPYQAVTERLGKLPGVAASALSQHSSPPVRDLDDLLDKALHLCREPGRHYVQAYWGEPDSTMHRRGCGHPDVRQTILDLDLRLMAFAGKLDDDCRLFVTADHGLIDAQPLFLEDHPALFRMLKRPPGMEPRASALHVQPEAFREFPGAFEEAFPGAFRLFPGESAVAGGLFGGPPYRDSLAWTVGDYFAIPRGRQALFYKREHCRVLGMHGGLCPEEVGVPLILCR